MTLGAVVLLAAAPALAQSNDDALRGFDEPKPAAPAGPIDEVLGGFDDKKPASRPDIGPPEDGALIPLPSWLRIGGSVGHEADVNVAHKAPAPGATDHRGLSSFKSRVDLEADIDFGDGWKGRAEVYAFQDFAYAINGRGGYTHDVLDVYENEIDTGEVYVQGRLADDLDLKTGRQIVVWGKSDNIRVTDVLNPLDNRTPGRTDIEDLRLPLTMTKLDYYLGAWNLSAIAVHELRFDKTPVFGSDFFGSPGPLPPEDGPRESFENQEAALALNGIFSGWDLSFYAARIFDDRAYATLSSAGPIRKHARLWMAGAAANVALGNWLIKGEAALFDGFRFRAAPGERFTRLDAMIGVEYSGFDDTTISFEIADRHLFDFDRRLENGPEDGREDDPQTALRITRKFMHETLELTFLAQTFGLTGRNGAIQRLQMTYDWTDSVEITGGAINYVSGDKQIFDGVGDNDRIFAEIVWRF